MHRQYSTARIFPSALWSTVCVLSQIFLCSTVQNNVGSVNFAMCSTVERSNVSSVHSTVYSTVLSTLCSFHLMISTEYSKQCQIYSVFYIKEYCVLCPLQYECSLYNVLYCKDYYVRCLIFDLKKRTFCAVSTLIYNTEYCV